MHNILDITDKQYIQDSTLLPVKKKFQFFYWFAFDSNKNYIPLWLKNFQPFMTQVHSRAFGDWESDVNDIQDDFENFREISFKKFITSMKTKTIFHFKPVGPFMEKKRPFESSPKYQNQNQDKRRKFDGSSKKDNVASKIPPCHMCKEKKNKENFHLESKCFLYARDDNEKFRHLKILNSNLMESNQNFH
ncbi:unnamed protein product [Bathycoccus prasinos]